MNKYEYEAGKEGREIDPSQPHTGQVHERLTRYDYSQGPMYYLGQQIVRAMEDSGYPAFIWCCYRSPAKQSEYLDKGTSKAGPWQSPHQFYEAVDILHPELYWQAPPDYWEQLAACVRIVAEKFGVELDHGHYWSWVDSAHVELEDWREFRERIRARWRDDLDEWNFQREEDPLSKAVMPTPSKPTEEELAQRFEQVLPKVWKQHVRASNPSLPPEFSTRRQRRDARRQARKNRRARR